jgi:nucleoside-diphosphate-sugar epimerase
LKQKSTILITGAAGFIGSQLGHSLAREGHRVRLLDNMSFGHLDNLIIEGKPFGEFYGRDIRDRDLSPCFKEVDTVFHLAGISALPSNQINPYEAYDNNVSGTANILENARAHGVKRVIFSSTSAVYEKNNKIPMKESDQVQPDLVYAMTKSAAEEVCTGFAMNYGMDIAIMRFFNVYGPHQDFKRVSPPFTSYVARELAADRTPTLYNNTDAKRDYVHVDDVIRLLKIVANSDEHLRADIFNVCSGQGYSVPEIYSLFLHISGKDLAAHYEDPRRFWRAYPQLHQGPFPLDPSRIEKEVYKHCIGDPTRTRDRFGWTPSIDLESGLKTVYQYALDHMSDFKSSP